MKLRLDDHSVRLRLSREEVAALEESNQVSLSTHFSPGAVLHVRLQAADVKCIGARLDEHGISIDLPKAFVYGWGEDERVGFEEVQPTGSGMPLRIVIEKDLDCRHSPKAETDVERAAEVGHS